MNSGSLVMKSIGACRKFLLGGLVAASMSANAVVVVSFDTAELGGGSWRLSYSLQGEAPAGGFEGVTVYFEPELFGSLANAVVPAGWDPLLVDPEDTLSGFFDMLRLDGPLTGSFSPISFYFDVEYSGAGAPVAPQVFELYQTLPDFAVVASGHTQHVSAVPEPATGALVLAALGAAFLRSRVAGRKTLQPLQPQFSL